MSDLEAAEATYTKAEEQVEFWSALGGDFARGQVEMWRGIMQANAWCRPGA